MVKKQYKKKGKKAKRRFPRGIVTLNQIHRFKRVYITDHDILNKLYVEGSIIGKLNNLPDYEEFTNLFDSYRITGMSAKFLYDKSAPVVGSAVSVSMLGTCTDKDDATALATEDQFWQYQDFQYRPLTEKGLTVYVKPSTASAGYAGGAFTGYMHGNSNAWIDCNSPAMEYYGIRYFIHDPTGSALGATVIGKMKIVVTLWFDCKYVR